MSVKDDRVDLVIADCGAEPGPRQRLVWEVATRLAPTRFHLGVWLSSDPGGDPLADALRAREIEVERLAAGLGGGWRGWLGAWRKLRRRRPALLHLHDPLGERRRWAAALAELCPESQVVISQATLDRAAAGPARLLERRLVGRAEALMVPEGGIADRLVRDRGASRERIRVLPDGIDPPDEEAEAESARRLRRSLGAGLFKPLWLCPSPLEAESGHETLISALARVRDAGVPFLAVWTGDGPRRGEVERLAREHGLEDRVRIGVDGESRNATLAAADLVILPGAHPGDGEILVEAMARARPIVAVAAGAAAERIENGVTGRLIPAESAPEMAVALEAMARLQDASRRMGAAAQSRVCDTHAWPHVVEELEAVYDDLLGLATFAPGAAAFHDTRR